MLDVWCLGLRLLFLRQKTKRQRKVRANSNLVGVMGFPLNAQERDCGNASLNIPPDIGLVSESLLSDPTHTSESKTILETGGYAGPIT